MSHHHSHAHGHGHHAHGHGHHHSHNDNIATISDSNDDSNATKPTDAANSGTASRQSVAPRDEEGAVLDGKDVVFRTRILNKHLTCQICMGYFRHATTIAECLHTFCRCCIFDHLQKNASAGCPTCDADLGPTPTDRIRYDRALQSIVDKVFPQFLEEEEAQTRKRKAEMSVQHSKKAAATTTTSSSSASLASKDVASAASQPKPNEKLTFSVEPEPQTNIPPLEKPFFRAPLTLVLQTFIDKILGPRLNLQSDKILLLFDNKIVNNETLEAIQKAKSINDPQKHMQFKFRLAS